MKHNVASQKWYVFAFDRTDNTPKTGDAANITAKIIKDGGSATATNDTNPTEIEDGVYAFDLTQAETNAHQLVILPESSTLTFRSWGCLNSCSRFRSTLATQRSIRRGRSLLVRWERE